jgi:hypothetical protein
MFACMQAEYVDHAIQSNTINSCNWDWHTLGMAYRQVVEIRIVGSTAAASIQWLLNRAENPTKKPKHVNHVHTLTLGKQNALPYTTAAACRCNCRS